MLLSKEIIQKYEKEVRDLSEKISEENISDFIKSVCNDFNTNIYDIDNFLKDNNIYKFLNNEIQKIIKNVVKLKNNKNDSLIESIENISYHDKHNVSFYYKDGSNIFCDEIDINNSNKEVFDFSTSFFRDLRKKDNISLLISFFKWIENSLLQDTNIIIEVKKIVEFLNDESNIDQKLVYPNGATTEEKAKFLQNNINKFSTISIDHLTIKPKNALDGIQYAFKPENAILILNSKYATDWKFDLAAGTFQLNQITNTFKKVIIQDFETLGLDSSLDLIIADEGVIKNLWFLDGATFYQIPKLYDEIYIYLYDKLYKSKNKILITMKEED